MASSQSHGTIKLKPMLYSLLFKLKKKKKNHAKPEYTDSLNIIENQFLKNRKTKKIHSYIPTFLYSYFPTFLNSYIHTFLHSYIPTFLFSYIPTFLNFYIATLLHSYIPTFHHSILLNLIDNKVMQPLWRGRTSKQTRIVASVASVLLSASVERFSVSRMRDFF